jgi:hypothetical protein
MRLRACTLALALAVLAWAPARAEEVVLVVVNPATPVRTLSSADIRDAYLGETAFWGHVKIHPATLRVPPELFAGFLAATLAITPSAYERSWMLRVFRDGGMPPRSFDTPADLLRFVARTPGAVGFVRPADLPDTDSVRVAARIPIANLPTSRPRSGA